VRRAAALARGAQQAAHCAILIGGVSQTEPFRIGFEAAQSFVNEARISLAILAQVARLSVEAF